MCFLVARETIPAIDIACHLLKYVIKTSSLSMKERLLGIEMCSCLYAHYLFVLDLRLHFSLIACISTAGWLNKP